MPTVRRGWPRPSGVCSLRVRSSSDWPSRSLRLTHQLALCRLLAEKEDERGRISALLAADGSVGSQVAERLAAVRRREQELRGLEDKRASLEERMRAFSGMSPAPLTRTRASRSISGYTSRTMPTAPCVKRLQIRVGA
jgi:hypothetical protein